MNFFYLFIPKLTFSPLPISFFPSFPFPFLFFPFPFSSLFPPLCTAGYDFTTKFGDKLHTNCTAARWCGDCRGTSTPLVDYFAPRSQRETRNKLECYFNCHWFNTGEGNFFPSSSYLSPYSSYPPFLFLATSYLLLVENRNWEELDT